MRNKYLHNNFYGFLAAAFLVLCSMFSPVKIQAQSCKAGYSFVVNDLSVIFTNSSSTANFYRSLWLFGDSTIGDARNPTHTYKDSGTYRVCLIIKDTVTKCTDTFCETVTLTKPVCKSGFSYSISGKYVSFMADSSLKADDYKFIWNTGDGTTLMGNRANYTYAQDGNYEVCLTVSKSIYCESKTCKKLTVGSPKYRISGNIDADKDPAYPGKVWLIVYDANDSTLKAVKDTTITKDSLGTHYVFDDVEPGTYYVKAALDSTSSKYSDYLPTYFERAIEWEKANKIVLSSANLSRNIHMVKGTNPGGPGFISGKISQGMYKNAGDPISDIEIMLLNETGNPVAYTYSDLNGEFAFTNLAFGTYQVYAEVPGLKTFPAIVTISESNQGRNNINLAMNSTNIVTAIQKANIQSNNEINIYPNPVNNVLHINLDNAASQDVQIVVYSITGKQMMNVTKTINEKSMELPVNQLTDGMYILEVKGRKSQILLRTNFIKAF